MRRLLAIIAVVAVVGSVVYYLHDEKIKVEYNEEDNNNVIIDNSEVVVDEKDDIESGESILEDNTEPENVLLPESGENIDEEHEFVSQKMLEYRDKNNFYAINNGVVSFVSISYYDGEPQYDVINLDRYSGMNVTNQELLKANDINLRKINVKEIYKNTFLEEYVSPELVEGLKNSGELPETNKYNNEIVLDLYKNLNAYAPINIEDVDMYIDKDSNLHMIVELPALAGATGAMNYKDVTVEY